ncbi:hypothetical protein RI129_005891 [Pyrocoelia pectoralis]|uniref:Uncharacterized protein n=1 Tax=Pyrocoelia pectoralis TaxID=417401 RepID=A0AAN7VFH1_9COLE
MEAWLITLIVILCVIFTILFVKYYFVMKIKWDNSATCLVGKTVLITGSNIGIGYNTALDFAKRGARVILACRNQEKAEDARAKIVDATGNSNVVVKIVDLSSLNSIRKFTKEINETEERLDILVNNAGIGCNDHSYTVDGLSLTMQSNHFGPFLLTILLIDLLKKSSPSRIVTVSSDLAFIGKININDLNRPVGTIFAKALDYSNTKLCNLLFTTELAKKLDTTGVTANAVHPGAVQTDFLKQPKTFWLKMLKISMKLFYRTTEAGAQTSIYVSVSKDIEGITGSFYIDCKKTSMPRSAQNADLCRKLWEKSEEFVKLTAEEKQCFKH